MLILYIPMIEFLVIKNWWFVANSTAVVQSEQPEYLFLKLLAPVCVVAVFWFVAWWLVRNNVANLTFERDCREAARVSPST
jgi:hypothetical protein